MAESRPNYRRRRWVAGVVALLVLVGIAALVWAVVGPREAPAPASSPATLPAVTATPDPTPTVAALTPTCDPDDVGALIDKRSPICPLDYVPDLVDVGSTGGQLRPEAAAAMDALVGQLSADTGLGLFSASAYRSFDTQVSTYQGWVDQDGQEAADRYSARPGYSEHQTGLAMDVGASSCGCTDAPFGATPESAWIVANAWRYGYIVRYPDGFEAITGYIWEPWHLRYVGVDIATAMHERGIATLEDYYGVPPAPDYG